MSGTTIRYSSFPRTEPPPDFAQELVGVFVDHEDEISTEAGSKSLKSDDVLAVVGPDLEGLGFQVETGKKQENKLERPVFFGENGVPTLRYEIDTYNPHWRCGLEVEAARAWLGNAVYRDLVQAAVMVEVDYLCLAMSRVSFTGSAVALGYDYGHDTDIFYLELALEPAYPIG